MKVEECDCDDRIFYGTFWLNGIERSGIYCEKCGRLLDYMPQYNED